MLLLCFLVIMTHVITLRRFADVQGARFKQVRNHRTHMRALEGSPGHVYLLMSIDLCLKHITIALRLTFGVAVDPTSPWARMPPGTLKWHNAGRTSFAFDILKRLRQSAKRNELISS